MQGFASYLLMALQWALIVLGALLVLVSLYIFYSDVRFYSSLPPIEPGRDFYIVPIVPRFITGVVIGLCSMGLGGVLFYLRRLFLSRQ